jgi:O-antigen/teichoic acid export membrane protein
MVRPFIASQKKFQFENTILKQGFWAQSAQAVQFFNYRLNFFLLAYYITDTTASNFAIGIYNNAIILSESVWILGHSIAQMQHMKILNTENSEANFKMNNNLVYLNFFGTLMLMLILIWIPEPFWAQLFSADFIHIHSLFLVTALGVVSFGISNILNHALHAASRFKEILFCNVVGLIAGTMVATQFMPQYNVFGAALAWSAGLFIAMLSYLLLYLYHHKKFYNRQKLFIMVTLSLIVFMSSMIVFRQYNSFADWHFIQRFCIYLSISLSLTVALNFIVHKLMYGIKPRNS